MIALPVELPKLIHESNGTECGKNDASSASTTTSISQHATSSKVRPVSKLSSRHRRKRRGTPENEDRSAKRNKERIPIPAFTSIPSKYYDLGAGRDEGECAPSEPCESASSEPLIATTPSVCRADTDPCLASADASTVKEACMDNGPIKQPDVGHTGEQIHDAPELSSTTLPSRNEGLICAKFPSDVDQSNESLQIRKPRALSSSSFAVSRSAEEGVMSARSNPSGTLIDAAISSTLAPSESDNMQSFARLIGNISGNTSISLTSVAVSESNSDMKSSAKAASSALAASPTPLSRDCFRTGMEHRDDRTTSDVLVHCPSEQPSSVNGDRKFAELLKEKEVEVEMSRPEVSIHPNNSLFDELTSFVYEESSSSLVETQALRVLDLCSNDDTDNMSKETNEKQSRSRHFDSMGTGESDSIGIVRDSHGDQRAVGDMSSSATAVKKEKLNKSGNAKAQGKRKTGVNASSKENVKNTEVGTVIEKSSTRRRNETRERTRTKSRGDAAKKNQSKSSDGKKKLCSACSNCDCADVKSHKLPTLSGSDARQEQTLINRLQRLEREIAWKEGQRHDVARALKKHQLKMLKKWGDLNSVAQKPRFLADVEMSDEVVGTCPIIGSEETKCAKTRVFGKQKSKLP